MLRTLIVDDEIHSTESLRILLEENCPQIQIIGLYNNALEALKFLKANPVDLLLLDINMPFLNGFELLNQIPNFSFKIIFTTAYDQFALKAFRYSAFDYLLKPVEEKDLISSVDRIVRQNTDTNLRYQHLLEVFRDTQQVKKIALPTFEGFEFVEVEKIIRLESDSNYTKVMLQNLPMIMVSRTLKEMEEILTGLPFIRVHHSHIIAKNHILKYIKADGGYILMVDKSEIPISRSRKEEVIKQFIR